MKPAEQPAGAVMQPAMQPAHPRTLQAKPLPQQRFLRSEVCLSLLGTWEGPLAEDFSSGLLRALRSFLWRLVPFSRKCVLVTSTVFSPGRADRSLSNPEACKRVIVSSLRLYRACTRRFTAFPGIERQYVVLQFALLIADEWCASR